MKILLSTALFLFCSYLFSQELINAYRIGGSGLDIADKIEVDHSGNIYLTGTFSQTVDFDPGPGSFLMTAQGEYDGFVVKLNNTGDFIWAVQIGGDEGDLTDALAIDEMGNVFVSGIFRGTVDFDHGDEEAFLTSLGEDDSYILKLNANGDFQWVKQIESTGFNTYITSMKIDYSGNLLVGGFFNGTAYFEFEDETIEIVSNGMGDDAFILKANTDGQFLWLQRYGGQCDDIVAAIDVDSDGNIYASGRFDCVANFGTLEDPILLTAEGNSEDVYIMKLSEDGSLQWLKHIKGEGYTGNFGLTIDQQENIYVTGSFRTPTDFDPGIDEFLMDNIGTQDAYVLKLNNDGEFVWAKQLSSFDTSIGLAIAVDNFGNVYTGGMFEQTVDFDPGPNEYILNGGSNGDAFLSKLDSDGNFVWAFRLGSTGTDECRSVTIDANDNIFYAGFFSWSADFDPSAGTNFLSSSGSWDAFFSKIDGNTVGLNSYESQIEAHLFPNPAKSFLNIQSKEKVQLVSIYNQLGDLVQTETRNSFSIEYLPSGVYMVHIKTQKGTSVQRIVKQ